MRNMFKFKSLHKPITLALDTKCPEKWLLIDRETGQVYQGSPNGHWDRLDPVIKSKEPESLATKVFIEDVCNNCDQRRGTNGI
jgi:hypothetical protein